MVVQMVAIGEESGAIDAMLGKVADWYEQEVDDAVEALEKLQAGEAVNIRKKADHRRKYLSFEGDLGDERGSVAIIWRGQWKSHTDTLPDSGTIQLDSGDLLIS